MRPHQVKQAEAQLKAADGAVAACLPETYQWLLAPIQKTPHLSIEIKSGAGHFSRLVMYSPTKSAEKAETARVP